MSSTSLLSPDEWIWRTDLAARDAEAAGFSRPAEAFRALSEGNRIRWRLEPIQDQAFRDPVPQGEAIANKRSVK